MGSVRAQEGVQGSSQCLLRVAPPVVRRREGHTELVGVGLRGVMPDGDITHQTPLQRLLSATESQL